jgi:hypothetical protein
MGGGLGYLSNDKHAIRNALLGALAGGIAGQLPRVQHRILAGLGGEDPAAPTAPAAPAGDKSLKGTTTQLVGAGIGSLAGSYYGGAAGGNDRLNRSSAIRNKALSLSRAGRKGLSAEAIKEWDRYSSRKTTGTLIGRLIGSILGGLGGSALSAAALNATNGPVKD